MSSLLLAFAVFTTCRKNEVREMLYLLNTETWIATSIITRTAV